MASHTIGFIFIVKHSKATLGGFADSLFIACYPAVKRGNIGHQRTLETGQRLRDPLLANTVIAKGLGKQGAIAFNSL